MKKRLLLFIKGIFIGAAVLVPGLSGGTAAMALGVYRELLESTAEFHKHVRQSSIFLGIVTTGAVAGIFAFSSLIRSITASFPFLAKIIFCFIALLSLFFFLQNSVGGGICFKDFFFVLSGMLPAALISLLLKGATLSLDNNLLLFPVGILLAAALVLPAISFSYMLLFFGIYEKCLAAISDLDIGFLLPLGAGIAAGILLCAKLFLFFIRRFSRKTYLVIAGFVFYSVFDIIIKTN